MSSPTHNPRRRLATTRPDLAIDATFVRAGRVGGAEQMLKALVGGILAVGDEPSMLIVTQEPPWAPGADGITWRAVPGRLNRFVAGSLGLRGVDAAAVLFPNYFTPPGVRAHAGRLVTVVHDLQYCHYPDFFPRSKRLWLRAAHEYTLRRSDRVVAISQFVADDIARRYGDRWKRKLVVIRNPIDWQRFEDDPGDPDLARVRGIVAAGEFVLSVAAHYPHKNLGRLVEAVRMVRRQPGFAELRLVLVGQLPDRLVGRNATRAPQWSEPWALHTGYISDAAVGLLYRHARAFVLPSLFEGFGMPAVEALGMGVPVVASGTTALPEATLGLAAYVEDPTSVEQLAAGIHECLVAGERGAPSQQAIDSIREAHDPARVARAYLDVLFG